LKRIIFVTHNIEDESDGIWKKICFQVAALRELGYTVDFFFARKGAVVCDNGSGTTIYTLAPLKKYSFYKVVREILSSNEFIYDYCYVRKPHGGLFSIYLAPLLVYLKNFGTKIIFEIPTYPYRSELKTFKDRLTNLVFDVSSLFFKKYIDIICFFGSPHENIWGIRCVRISNGIDVNTVNLIPEKKYNDQFILLGVANLSFWHGYDRLLYGLAAYTGPYHVVFKVIGDTEPELSRLKRIANGLGIEKNVQFCGRLSGKKLEEEFYNADVCIDAVGRHRSGNAYNSSIKSKEYTARGLPFIKSHRDDAFNNNEFILEVEPSDKPINIDNIIVWRRNLAKGFSLRERQYAIDNLTWTKQLQDVFKAI
jgi:glycosyltransferase involved in cell wall biosynthesis